MGHGPRDLSSRAGRAKGLRLLGNWSPLLLWRLRTGLFFTNAILEQMGMMQVRIAALDDPNAIAPKIQVQTAEEIGWMKSAHSLPAFERFPA